MLRLNLYSQSRWSNIYYPSENAYGLNIGLSYDKGYIIVGKHGSNAVEFNWLIKTDINGEILWEKTLGSSSHIFQINDMAYNDFGDLYLIGLTDSYNNDNYDPLIMKLNSCGEKQWCRVFMQNDNNFSNVLRVTSDNGVAIVLKYMGTDPFIDDICLAKFDINGNLQWKQCYTSPDSALHGFDSFDLTLAPDGGFLLSGFCSYEDPNPPHYWSAKPYFLKTDSLGIYEWETVVHKDIASIGGDAYSTVLNPDSTFYYCSLNHNYHSAGDAAALLKMDLSGNVIGIYDLAPPNTYGKMMRAKFINDSTLMASAVWGPIGPPKAVIIDTLGNIQMSTILLDNDYMAHTEVTFDDKLLYLTNIADDLGNFDAYLFKFNHQLQSDTIYNQIFTYDSLCSYQIVSDTIAQDDCEVIVSNNYLSYGSSKGQLKIFPNPAKESFMVQVKGIKQQVSSIDIFNSYGQSVYSPEIFNTDTCIVVNSSDWQGGIYIMRVLYKDGTEATGKVMVIQ
ncbi:MAG: T9SS type A sorting domain-containing protein [Chloroflexota bacterium]